MIFYLKTKQFNHLNLVKKIENKKKIGIKLSGEIRPVFIVDLIGLKHGGLKNSNISNAESVDVHQKYISRLQIIRIFS